MYLRLLETLPKHGLVSTFRICFLKEKSLEKWRRALLRVACPGPVDSCDYEVDEPLLHVSLELIRHGLENKYICKIGPTHSPHSGLQLTNTVHPDVSAEDSCFFCSSWTYSCRWSYLMMCWRGSPMHKKLKSNTWKTVIPTLYNSIFLLRRLR